MTISGLILILFSVNAFSLTQVVECKSGNDYNVTLSIEIENSVNQSITYAEIEYSGEDLISGLWKGQTTGDSTDKYGDMEILEKKINGVEYISFQGKAWNPSADDPAFYAIVIPASAIGKNLKNGEIDVFLGAEDDRYGSAEGSFQKANGPTENCWAYVK